MIGAFYQPRLVLADTDALATLPRRELLAGYAETVKYGLIRDAEFFAWCERQGNALCALEPDPVRHAVVTSCRMKAAIVAADEREEGDRALLNFGHTFGHALEDRNRVFAAGCCMARRWRWAWCWPSISPRGSGSSRRRRASGCAAISRRPGCRRGSPMSGSPASRPSACLAHMGKDKKVRDGRITLILPRRIGDAFVMKDAPVDELRDFLSTAA